MAKIKPNPRYLARICDGTIFYLNNKTKKYSTGLRSGHAYTYECLMGVYAGSFEPIKKSQFPEMQQRAREFSAYVKWKTRPDGHGGIKGGSIEEFKALPEYKTLIKL